jgi:hypothetical protein
LAAENPLRAASEISPSLLRKIFGQPAGAMVGARGREKTGREY